MPVAGVDIMPSRKVCRCLWPVDHEQRKKELAKIASMLEKRDTTKWNFDFKSDSPKAGRYHWELVNPNSPDIPRAYELANLSLTPISRLSISRSDDESSDNLVTDVPVTSDRPSTPVQSRKRSRAQMEERQTLITEFFCQKKNAKRRKFDL